MQIQEEGATSGPGLLANYSYDGLERRNNAFFAGSAGILGEGILYDYVSRPALMGYGFAQSSANDYLSLSFDPSGGIATRTHSNSQYDWPTLATTYTSYAINNLNQVTSAHSASYSYNGRGFTNSDGTNTYTYDNLGRMTGANSASLAYDGLSRLAQTTSSMGSTTQMLYDGDRLVAEYDGSGNLLRRYVFDDGEDHPVVWYEGSGTSDRRWLLSDLQGSIMAVANASGSLMQANSYDDYGLPGAYNLGRFGYTGQAFIPEVGLNYYKARMYSPGLGRFLTPDPTGYADGPNMYGYTHNDPINGTDPTGTQDGCSTGTAVPGGIADCHSALLDGENGPTSGAGEGGAAVACAPGDVSCVTIVSMLGGYPQSYQDFSQEYGSPSQGSNGAGQQSNGRNCSVAPANAGQYAAATAESVVMTAEFFSGLGNATPTFGPDTATSQVLGQSAGVQAALGQYQSTGATSGLYSFGLSGLAQAGANPVAQFVGSFRYSISGNILSVTNTTSFKSLTYDSGPQFQRSQFAPMGNTHQTYNIRISCH